MERMVFHLRAEEKAAVKALARAEQRTIPGMARRLVVEALARRGITAFDMDETAKAEALRELQELQALQAQAGGGNGASDAE